MEMMDAMLYRVCQADFGIIPMNFGAVVMKLISTYDTSQYGSWIYYLRAICGKHIEPDILMTVNL
jgi:hypothetical protein